MPLARWLEAQDRAVVVDKVQLTVLIFPKRGDHRVLKAHEDVALPLSVGVSIERPNVARSKVAVEIRADQFRDLRPAINVAAADRNALRVRIFGDGHDQAS